LPDLFRSFLPLENPIGFGFQDFVEFGFVLLLAMAAWALRQIARRHRAMELLPLIIAVVLGHFILAQSLRQLTPRQPVRRTVSPFEEVK